MTEEKEKEKKATTLQIVKVKNGYFVEGRSKEGDPTGAYVFEKITDLGANLSALFDGYDD